MPFVYIYIYVSFTFSVGSMIFMNHLDVLTETFIFAGIVTETVLLELKVFFLSRRTVAFICTRTCCVTDLLLFAWFLLRLIYFFLNLFFLQTVFVLDWFKLSFIWLSVKDVQDGLNYLFYFYISMTFYYSCDYYYYNFFSTKVSLAWDLHLNGGRQDW